MKLLFASDEALGKFTSESAKLRWQDSRYRRKVLGALCRGRRNRWANKASHVAQQRMTKQQWVKNRAFRRLMLKNVLPSNQERFRQWLRTDEHKKLMSIRSRKVIWADPAFRIRKTKQNRLLALRNHELGLNVPRKHTKIERHVQEFLTSLGIGFDTHRQVKALHKTHLWDIIIEPLRLLIEVDGCYWHACSIHHPEMIKGKFDLEFPLVRRLASNNDWKIVRLWEHEIKAGTFKRKLNLR